jgi:predicted dehydrogenase
LARVFGSLGDCRVTAICDRNTQRLRHYSELFPDALATVESDDLLDRDVVDAVVIATPTITHYALAAQALTLGIHTFVEKPLATTSAECEELIDLGRANQAVLFVGHVFIYSAPVTKLKDLVASGELGDLYYISSSRLNLGPVRHDVNALWDLAPHDVSIMLELMDDPPVSVSCSGLAHLNDRVHDVCSLTLQFSNKRMGIIHVSWLDPHKKRVMTIVGSKKMAVYDDLDPLEKIKVYDHGIDAPPYTDSFGDFRVSYRYGDTYSPRLVEVEPLKAECQNFIQSIMDGSIPRTNGHNGLEVVRVIEAANVSLHNGNGRIALANESTP